MDRQGEELSSACIPFSESADVMDRNFPYVRLCVGKPNLDHMCTHTTHTHTPTFSLLSKPTHRAAHRAGGLPLVTQSGVTVHGGW